MNLEQEKQDIIINSALEEFARNGYKKASTNEIVKKANISKGLLFHYFGSKKNLFMFLYKYSKDILLDEFYDKVDYSETDVIKRWKQIIILKLELVRKYPILYDFMLESIADDSIEIKKEMEDEVKKSLEEGTYKLFSNIDALKFKDGMDVKKILEIIIWTAQGFSNREVEHIKIDPSYKDKINNDALVEEFDLYLELLKNAFYKAHENK